MVADLRDCLERYVISLQDNFVLVHNNKLWCWSLRSVSYARKRSIRTWLYSSILMLLTLRKLQHYFCEPRLILLTLRKLQCHTVNQAWCYWCYVSFSIIVNQGWCYWCNVSSSIIIIVHQSVRESLYCTALMLYPACLFRWWQVPYYWAGIKAYDIVAGKQTLKSSYYLRKSKALEEFPMLKSNKLCGTIVYYDGEECIWAILVYFN